MVLISYNNLWKLLVDKGMNKSKLRELTGLGTGTMAKLSKCEPVGLEVLAKICYALNCKIEDVVEFVYERN